MGFPCVFGLPDGVPFPWGPGSSSWLPWPKATIGVGVFHGNHQGWKWSVGTNRALIRQYGPLSARLDYCRKVPRVMVFTDGENLCLRGQEVMKQSNIELKEGRFYLKDAFLWMSHPMHFATIMMWLCSSPAMETMYRLLTKLNEWESGLLFIFFENGLNQNLRLACDGFVDLFNEFKSYWSEWRHPVTEQASFRQAKN